MHVDAQDGSLVHRRYAEITMKKLMIPLALVLLLVCASPLLSVRASAADDPLEDISEQIPDDAGELLDELGLDSEHIGDIFEVSPGRFFSMAAKLVKGEIESPLRSLVRLMSVIVMLAVCECFVPEDSPVKQITETAGTLMCILSVMSPLSDAISSAVSSIGISEDLMLALIPILVSLLTVTGNPALALSFQSAAFFAAQVISGITETVTVPLVGVVMSLDITGAVMPGFRLSGITDFIKKAVTAALSFAATLFVSFLGIKGALAGAADTVASKGIKLVISSAVPVIGGALSEAYSGVIGSLVLVRSTAGVLSIAAIAVVCLPSCVQLLFWIFALRAGAALGELFNRDGISSLLRAVSSAVTLLNVVLIFNAVLFIISTALIVTVKAV